MPPPPPQQDALLPTLFWFAGLLALASLLTHLNYTLQFAGASGQWFRGKYIPNITSWIVHLLCLFGPSLALVLIWLRREASVALPWIALLGAAFGYVVWQPIPLGVLSLVDLYPSHLEAFHNFFYRGDWRLYE